MSGDNNDKIEKRRYNYMENVLQNIISKISVNEEDRKRNNQILTSAIDIILGKMRNASNLFSKLYQKTFYGGSYYDNLKTGKPDEYDIDLLMNLSKKNFKLIPVNEAPGFVKMQVLDKNETYDMPELFDGEYLCTKKILKWMEGLVSKAINELPQSGSQAVLKIQDTDFLVKIVKSGPAFTLVLNGQIDDTHVNFSVDLVPCFVFGESMWPNGNFRSNPVKEKSEFFIVPKQPKANQLNQSNYCWRLSFQEQERQLIHGSRTLKPCIKLLKKLRDNLQQKAISSYFIKTMFIWETLTRGKCFWDNSLSYVFVEMLQVYERRLRDKNIPYFWNEKNNYNLIESLTSITAENYANRLKGIIADINGKESSNPHFIAKFFLKGDELQQLQIDIPVVAKTVQKETDNVVTKICNCGLATELDSQLKEMRSEIEEARREQENIKAEILDLLRVVVKRLDHIDSKLL